MRIIPFASPDIVTIVVGYENSVYTTTEQEGAVELCVVILAPETRFAPRSFVLRSSPIDGSAGI